MRILIITALLIPMYLGAQDTLRYSDCLGAAVDNSPRLLDKQLIDEEGQLTQENIQTSWLPDMTINGRFSYQSDVVTLDFEIPNVPLSLPEMPHSQYGVNLDIRQTLYDGGITKKRQQYEAKATATTLQKVDVDLHGIKASVSSKSTVFHI